jgi:hypothetical protein
VNSFHKKRTQAHPYLIFEMLLFLELYNNLQHMKKNKNIERHILTVAEFAELSGFTRQHINSQISNGALDHAIIAGKKHVVVTNYVVDKKPDNGINNNKEILLRLIDHLDSKDEKQEAMFKRLIDMLELKVDSTIKRNLKSFSIVQSVKEDENK